jgi:hypothetical protein
MTLHEHGYFWWNTEPVSNHRFPPPNAVPGSLAITDEGGISLDLDGVLPGFIQAVTAIFDGQGSVVENSIQGILTGTANHVFLLRPLRIGGNVTQFPRERFFASACLVADDPFSHSSTLLKFFKLEINLKGFEEWMQLSSIAISRNKRLVSTNYRQRKELRYKVDDEKLFIKYDIECPVISGTVNERRVTLNETATLVYQLRKSATLEEMQELYGIFQELFVLLTGSEYPLDWPVLCLGRERRRCKLYFYRIRAAVSPPTLVELWTFFPMLQPSFGAIFSIWRWKRRTFGAGFYLYLGTRRGMRLYADHHFINLIWGIEALHRRQHPIISEPPALKKKIDRILSQISANRDRRWLRSQLRYEPSLEQRIFETFKNLPIAFDEKRLREFSRSCAEKRNEISHFGGSRHGDTNLQDSRELQTKSEALAYLYHILLLREIGVGSDWLKSFVHQGMQVYTIKKALFDAGLIDEETLKSTGSPPGA